MNYVTSDTELTAIADAIRAKAGTPDEMLTYPEEYISAIEGLEDHSDVESVMSAIRSKFPENLWDPETESAQVEQGVSYTVSAYVTFDGESHYYAMMAMVSGGPPNYVTQSYQCDMPSQTPADGDVKRLSVTFTPNMDGTFRLMEDSGLTVDRVMLEVGNNASEYHGNSYVFPGDYVAMVNKMTAEEATGVYF